jgi:hypothetical protein
LAQNRRDPYLIRCLLSEPKRTWKLYEVDNPSDGGKRRNSGNRYCKACRYPYRLFVPPAECVAVSGLDEPTELAVFRGPDHPLKGKLTGNLRPAARSSVTQLRACSDHKLDMLVDGERLLEQKISLPFRLARTE